MKFSLKKYKCKSQASNPSVIDQYQTRSQKRVALPKRQAFQDDSNDSVVGCNFQAVSVFQTSYNLFVFMLWLKKLKASVYFHYLEWNSLNFPPILQTQLCTSGRVKKSISTDVSYVTSYAAPTHLRCSLLSSSNHKSSLPA